MGGAPGVDVDRGPKLRQAPGRPRVVQVDVGHEDVAHLLGGHPLRPQGLHKPRVAAFRPRLHEDGPLPGVQEKARDDPLRPLEAEVQDLHHGLSSLGPMRVKRVPTPSTATSSRSPGLRAPTPSGVPVRTTSKGSRVMKVEM